MTYIEAINRDFESCTLEMLSHINTLKKQLEVLESLKLQERLERIESKAKQINDLNEKIQFIELMAQEKEFIKDTLAEVEFFPFNTTNESVSHSGDLVHSTPEQSIDEQVKRVAKRVPTWIHKYLVGLNPRNGTILMRFLELSAQNTRPVMRYELEEACKSVSNFATNYHNMRNMLPNNHGKVFEEINSEVTLWQPVANIVLEAYNRARDSQHSLHSRDFTIPTHSKDINQ